MVIILKNSPPNNETETFKINFGKSQQKGGEIICRAFILLKMLVVPGECHRLGARDFPERRKGSV
jgi:hypothetical protein